MSARYAPGPLATLATPEGVVLVGGEPSAVLGRLVALAEQDLTPLTIVQALANGDLADLPEFAAVRRTATELRALVRGRFEVRVDGAAVVDGLSASTWIEHTVALLPGACVDVVAVGAPDLAASAVLPLVGVALTAGVRHLPTGAAAVAAPAAPADEFTTVRQRPTAPPAGPPTPVAPAPPIAAPSAPAPVAPAPVAPAPVMPVVAAPAAPPSPAPSYAQTAQTAQTAQPAALADGFGDADHDGRTITPAQLQALRAAGGGPAAPAALAPLLALEFSSGRVVPVRRRVLIGRSPRIQQVGGSANLPALVTLDDPYVSGTHVEVAVDAGRVTVTDLSTNGTLLARPGRVPEQLAPGVATEIAVGDVLTLSKGLTATVVHGTGG